MVKGKRTTVYNSKIVTPELWRQVARTNQGLLRDFLNYCASNDKSPSTIHQYQEMLSIFFIWNLKENHNQIFPNIKKREFVNFFGYGRNEMKWSPNRLATFRAVLSSLSNYIERILDDEYPTFRNVVKVLEPIRVEPVREKTILTPEEIEKILSVLVEQKQFQEACWLALLYSSGMRKSEAVQMKVDFFNSENIVFDIMYRTSKIRTKGRGKMGKQVPRYIFTYTFDPYLKMWLEEREKLGITNEFLFVVKKDGQYQPATVVTFNSWARRIGDLMGVDFYPHVMRHAWTTKLKKGGYPDSIIQKLQNWANADMVAVYDDTGQEEELSQFFKERKGNEN